MILNPDAQQGAGRGDSAVAAFCDCYGAPAGNMEEVTNLLSRLCSGGSGCACNTDRLRVQAADGHVRAAVTEQCAVAHDLLANECNRNSTLRHDRLQTFRCS